MGPKSPGVPLELNNEALEIFTLRDLPKDLLIGYVFCLWIRYDQCQGKRVTDQNGLYENDHHEFFIHVDNFCSLFQKKVKSY
jgi:hypothetical protein